MEASPRDASIDKRSHLMTRANSHAIPRRHWIAREQGALDETTRSFCRAAMRARCEPGSIEWQTTSALLTFFSAALWWPERWTWTRRCREDRRQ